jgi:hypothetical protein
MICCDSCNNGIVDGVYLPRLSNRKPTCRAFPNGIPQDILDGDVLHREVRPDQDNDIVYETYRRSDHVKPKLKKTDFKAD